MIGALDQLHRQFGGDWSTWRWGQAHQARFPHLLFSHIPLFDRLFGFAVPTDGGADTVNRAVPRLGGSSATRYADMHGPGYRAIYDLADLETSRFMIATGQSGNPLSAFYGNLAKRWSDGRYLRLAEPPDPVRYRLRLNPG